MNKFFTILSAAALVAMFATACGDNGTPDTDEGTDTASPDVIITLDVVQDAGNDASDHDTAADGVEPVDSMTETGTDVQVDIPPDDEPPFVVASYPADEETGVPIPFEIRVTFNEDIRYEVTVNKNTFKLYDIHDQEIPGTLSYDPVSFTVTFTPDDPDEILTLSPYKVWLSEMIQDRAGNRMTEYSFTFATGGPVQMESYLPIAVKYAPNIYQSTTQASPQWDYPTLLNFDGDWSAENNNAAYAAATSIPVWVYYDVVETYTHYYIRYHYYYVRHQDTSRTYGNEVAGVMVVVQKNPERPIAAETYFGTSSYEDIRSFVTEESGLVVDDGDGDYNDSDRKNYNANWVFPQDQLFPGNHFQSYVTTSSHESCAWIQVNHEDNMDFKCQLDSATKTQLKIVHFAYTDGTAGTMNTPFAYSNAEGSEVGYGLRLAINDWWVRRDATGTDGMLSSNIEYDAPDGFLGDGLVMPGSFKGSPSGSAAGGKTPWRWTWKPAVNVYNYYIDDLSEGTFYVHPAYYFARRHRVTLSTDTTGYSGAYCYNPYLYVDQRGQSADCLALE